jgi:hypothetical protein
MFRITLIHGPTKEYVARVRITARYGIACGESLIEWPGIKIY